MCTCANAPAGLHDNNDDEEHHRDDSNTDNYYNSGAAANNYASESRCSDEEEDAAPPRPTVMRQRRKNQGDKKVRLITGWATDSCREECCNHGCGEYNCDSDNDSDIIVTDELDTLEMANPATASFTATVLGAVA